jgi:hypothetical protein
MDADILLGKESIMISGELECSTVSLSSLKQIGVQGISIQGDLSIFPPHIIRVDALNANVIKPNYNQPLGQPKTLTLEADLASFKAKEIILDNPEGRSSEIGTRRALAHTTDDALTINPENDYPYGVTVDSNIEVRKELKVQKAVSPLGHAFAKSITITDQSILVRSGTRRGVGAITPRSGENGPNFAPQPTPTPIPSPQPLDLVAEVIALRKELNSLKLDVQKLRPSP